MRNRIWTRVGTAALLVGVLLVGFASSANAAPAAWGQFTRDNVPVYSAGVDGWGCYAFGACAPETRRPGDPAPIARDPRFPQRELDVVDLTCTLGNYLKIRYFGQGTELESGWVARRDLYVVVAPRGCHPFDF